MTEQKQLLDSIIEGIQERKGKKITLVDLSGIENVATQNFIICQGTSTMHVSSIADSIREYVREKTGDKPFNYDGYYAHTACDTPLGKPYGVHLLLQAFHLPLHILPLCMGEKIISPTPT